MIYLHCGWPKTGCTSLQAALVASSEALRTAGTLYPEKWRRELDGSHNDLQILLSDAAGSQDRLGELSAFAKANKDTDLLFSSESLTGNLLAGERRYRALTALLTVAQSEEKLHCLWTLRRFDDMLNSLCTEFAAQFGVSLVREFVDSLRVDEIWVRMGEIELIADRVDYVKYDSHGGHNRQVLEACGVRRSLAASIAKTAARSRRNVSRTRKQLAAIDGADCLSEEVGRAVTRREVERVLDGGLRFADDGPCEWFGASARRRLHDRMLSLAEQSKAQAYAIFFDDDAIDDAKEMTPVGFEVLSDVEIAALVHRLRAAAGETRGAVR